MSQGMNEPFVYCNNTSLVGVAKSASPQPGTPFAEVKRAPVAIVAGADSETLIARGLPTMIGLTFAGATDTLTTQTFYVDEAAGVVATENTEWALGLTGALSAAAFAAYVNANQATLHCTAVVVGAEVQLTPKPYVKAFEVACSAGGGGGVVQVARRHGTKRVRLLDYRFHVVGTTPALCFASGYSEDTQTEAESGVILVAAAATADDSAGHGLLRSNLGASLWLRVTSGAADGGAAGLIHYVLD